MAKPLECVALTRAISIAGKTSFPTDQNTLFGIGHQVAIPKPYVATIQAFYCLPSFTEYLGVTNFRLTAFRELTSGQLPHPHCPQWTRSKGRYSLSAQAPRSNIIRTRAYLLS